MKWVLVALSLIVTGRAQARLCEASVYSTKDKDQPGTQTASGIPLNDHRPTMAYSDYKAVGWMRVTNRKTGKIVLVLMTDKGPFVTGRCVDFSVAAAKEVGCDGLCKVSVEPWSPK